MSGNEVTAWRLRCWDDVALVDRWLDEGYVSMSTDEMGRPVTELSEKQLRRILETAHPERKPQAIGQWVGYWRMLTEDIAVGDVVVVPLPRRHNRDTPRAAIAEVTGGYEYDAADELYSRHRRRVQWHATVPRADLEPFGLKRPIETPATVARFTSPTAVRDLTSFFKA